MKVRMLMFLHFACLFNSIYTFMCICVCLRARARRGHTHVFGGVITDSSVWPHMCSFISTFPYLLSLYASSLNCRTTSWITEKLGFDSRR